MCHRRSVPRMCVAIRSLVSFKDAPLFSPSPPGTAYKHPPFEVPCYVTPDVVSEAEEQALLAVSGAWFDRIDYNEHHVDALIHHYKEFYRHIDELMKPQSSLLAEAVRASPLHSSEFPAEEAVEQTVGLCQSAIERCRKLAQAALSTVPLSNRVHFLQLTASGFIRAHVDDSRNSSGIVAGLTLGSARVMALTHPKHAGQRIELLLKPRSFYMLLGTARTEWEHSVDWATDDQEHIQRVKESLVVEGSEVLFEGQPSGFRRGTRTAVVFRGVSPMDLLLYRMEQKRLAESSAESAER